MSMKVDFRKVPIENIEGEVEHVDFSKSLGNTIFSSSKDVGESGFGIRIYHEGEVEVSKEMSAVILRFAEEFPYVIRRAFETLLKAE